MLRLNAAWEILRDRRRRAIYDASFVPTMSADPASTVVRDQTPSQPHWTGAAGPPPGRPSGTRIDFGLYAGWTLGEIARHDAGYLQWLGGRPEGRPYASEINRLLEPILGRSVDPGSGRPRWSF
jgi:curved DNA-binding protein CbpA